MQRHLILFLFISLVLSACRNGSSEDKPVLAVSIEPQRYLLEQIAGDNFTVMTVLTPGTNPETFDPPMSQRLRLEDADVYFTIGGLPFEHALTHSLKHPEVYNTSDGIDYIHGTHGDSHNEDQHHDHGNYDPHVWSSVQNARIIAANMYRKLCEIYPAETEGLTQRYRKLDASLDSLDKAFASKLKPKVGSTFMVWHPSLSYLARDYGLNQLSVGWESKEVSPSKLRSIIDRASAEDVQVFFFQKEYDSRQSETINSQIGARMIIIDPLAYDWQEQITFITDEIAR